MASLRTIKERKNTVSTIGKITKAMELVANSKIKKTRKYYDQVLEYSYQINEIFSYIYSNNNDVKNFFKININNPKVYLINTSDMGMCGPYNNNIIKLAKKTIKENDLVFIIGSIGVKSLTNFFKKEQIIETFVNVGDAPNYKIINKILDFVYPLILNNEISSFNVISTNFTNSITFEPKINQIFPYLKWESKKEKAKQFSKNLEFLPDLEIFLKKSLPVYLGAIIFMLLSSSKVSEMSSRRMAMESASNNANEIINDLEQQYNRLRQEKITQEISEIVSGGGSYEE